MNRVDASGLYAAVQGLPKTRKDVRWTTRVGVPLIGRPPDADARVDPRAATWHMGLLGYVGEGPVREAGRAGGVIDALSRHPLAIHGPVMMKMWDRYISATGKPYRIAGQEVLDFLRSSPEDLEYVRRLMLFAAQEAEDILVPGMDQPVYMISDWRDVGGLGPMQNLSMDWAFAVWNHCGHAKVKVSADGDQFRMDFTWVIDDTFTLLGKAGGKAGDLAKLERAGVFLGFLIDGEYTWRNVVWRRGAFRAPDPLLP